MNLDNRIRHVAQKTLLPDMYRRQKPYVYHDINYVVKPNPPANNNMLPKIITQVYLETMPCMLVITSGCGLCQMNSRRL